MAAEPVQHTASSHIKEGSTYDPDTQELIIQFSSGRYAYSGVPQSTVAEFSSAPSAGKYLDSFVKGIYPYKKL